MMADTDFLLICKCSAISIVVIFPSEIISLINAISFGEYSGAMSR